MNDMSARPPVWPVPDETDGSLRRAVDAVRQEPIPPDALHRALERARFVAAPSRPHRRRRWRLLAAAAVAAVVLLSAALASRQDEPEPRPVPPSVTQKDSGSRSAFVAFQPVRPVAFSQTAMTLASTAGPRPLALGGQVTEAEAAGNVIHLWDVARGRKSRLLTGSKDWVGAIAFSADGKTLASGGPEGMVRLWDVASGKQLAQHQGPVVAVAFAPNGKALAVQQGNGDTGVVRLWDVANGRELRKVDGQVGHFPSFTFSPDGNRLATACDDGTVRVWNVVTGKELCRLPRGHDQTVTTVAFSPDGKLLATGAADNVVRVWDVATGKALRLAVPARDGVAGWTSIVAFSPDGRLLAGGTNQRIVLWQAATGKELLPFPADSAGSAVLIFSPDGRTLASVCAPFFLTNINGRVQEQVEVFPTVRLWEVATGKERYCFQGGQASEAVGLWQGKKTGLGWGGGKQNAALRPTELPALWTDLAAEDASKAYAAGSALAAVPQQTLPFLATQLRPVAAVEQGRLARLINELNHDRFDVRDRASRELFELRELAAPACEKALTGHLTLETRRRLQILLLRLQGPEVQVQRLRTLRGVEVLEHLDTPEARQLLQTLAHGAPEAWLTQEARAAVQRQPAP